MDGSICLPCRQVDLVGLLGWTVIGLGAARVACRGGETTMAGQGSDEY